MVIIPKAKRRSRTRAGSSHPSFLSFSLYELNPLFHSCLAVAEPQIGSKVACVFSSYPSGISRPRRYSQVLLTQPLLIPDLSAVASGQAFLHVLRVRLKLYKRQLRTQTKV